MSELFSLAFNFEETKEKEGESKNKRWRLRVWKHLKLGEARRGSEQALGLASLSLSLS